jgi:hypothetical protein
VAGKAEVDPDNVKALPTGGCYCKTGDYDGALADDAVTGSQNAARRTAAAKKNSSFKRVKGIAAKKSV